MTLAPTPFQVDDGSPFGNLPDVMIEELLASTSKVEKELVERFGDLPAHRTLLRRQAEDQGVIRNLPDVLPDVSDRSVIAVDGSRVIERMTGVDIYAAAAVGVHGFGRMPSLSPNYMLKQGVVTPARENARIVDGIMQMLELGLAADASGISDLVVLDGSLYSAVLNAGIAFFEATERDEEFRRTVDDLWTGLVRDSMLSMLRSERLVSIPKRSTAANEFQRVIPDFPSDLSEMSGLAIANLLLRGGELTTPFHRSFTPLGLQVGFFGQQLIQRLDAEFERQCVVYFKPMEWSPAYRLEVAERVAIDDQVLIPLLAQIRNQIVNPAMIEMYPMYVADRFARNLRRGFTPFWDSGLRGAIVSGLLPPDLIWSIFGSGRTERSRDEEEETEQWTPMQTTGLRSMRPTIAP